MKFLLVLFTALTVSTFLTACGEKAEHKQPPPSMATERDSMPDNLDKAEQEK